MVTMLTFVQHRCLLKTFLKSWGVSVMLPGCCAWTVAVSSCLYTDMIQSEVRGETATCGTQGRANIESANRIVFLKSPC